MDIFRDQIIPHAPKRKERDWRFLADFTYQHPLAIALNLFIFGLCLIVFSRIQPMLSMAQLPEILYGANFATSLGCLLVAAAPVFYGCYFLRQREVDWFSIAFFITAAIVSLHYIHISNNTAPTPDWDGHLGRIRFISTHWLEPYGYNGWQRHHPPVYYYLAAVVMWVVRQIGTIPELTAVRFLSWSFFLIFHIYNLLTVQRAHLSKNAHYIVAGLITLWPMGLCAAGQFSNEALYYAIYAASFYYLVCWYEERHLRLLGIAITLALFSFTVRSGSVIILGIVALTVLVQMLRGQFSLREMPIKLIVILAIFALCCGVISVGKLIFTNDTFIGVEFGKIQSIASYMLSFDYQYLLNTPNDTFGQKSYGTMLVRSILFSDYAWQNPKLITLLSFLLITLFAYMIPAMIAVRHATLMSALPYIIGIIVPFTAHIFFSVLTKNVFAGNARYIYPIILCFSVLYGMSYSHYKRSDYFLLTILGPILAFAFCLVSVYFLWNNPR